LDKDHFEQVEDEEEPASQPDPIIVIGFLLRTDVLRAKWRKNSETP
jgi:hypothetical protein